jgi:hypothetical protein
MRSRCCYSRRCLHQCLPAMSPTCAHLSPPLLLGTKLNGEYSYTSLLQHLVDGTVGRAHHVHSIRQIQIPQATAITCRAMRHAHCARTGRPAWRVHNQAVMWRRRKSSVELRDILSYGLSKGRHGCPGMRLIITFSSNCYSVYTQTAIPSCRS